MVEIALVCVIGLQFVFMGMQMRSNATLVDKLMAKDYREYKELESQPEPVEIEKVKSMGWADDVPMDDED